MPESPAFAVGSPSRSRPAPAVMPVVACGPRCLGSFTSKAERRAGNVKVCTAEQHAARAHWQT
jgi:hypothetical protein